MKVGMAFTPFHDTQKAGAGSAECFSGDVLQNPLTAYLLPQAEGILLKPQCLIKRFGGYLGSVVHVIDFMNNQPDPGQFNMKVSLPKMQAVKRP